MRNFIACSFPYVGSEAFRAWLKAIPGVRWDKATKKWVLPTEVVPLAELEAEKRGLKFEADVGAHTYFQPTSVTDSMLYPPQKRELATAFHMRRWPLVWDTGCGKSAAAIVLAKAWQCRRILVVTRSLVKWQWVVEFDNWWPEHPEIGVVTAGRARKNLSKAKKAVLDAAYGAPIQIVSYALLDHVAKLLWDLVVADEAHSVKNPETAQAETLAEVLASNRGCAFLPLTATLIPDQPKDCWNVLDLARPGQFGEVKGQRRIPWKFLNRYTLPFDNGYGTTWVGLNPDNAVELGKRVQAVTSRLTKAEVAPYMPPFSVEILPIDTTAAPIESFDSWKAIQSGLDSGTAEKMPFVKEWVENQFDAGQTHIALVTHLRETTQELQSQLLSTGAEVFRLTGEMSPEARNEALALAKAASKAIVIATMHSVGIGIDLTFCPAALLVELYYRPETVVQLLGRFSRLSGKVPSSVQILVRRNTIDERIAKTLLDKIRNINQIVKAGDGEEKLSLALGEQRSDEELLSSLNTALLEEASW